MADVIAAAGGGLAELDDRGLQAVALGLAEGVEDLVEIDRKHRLPLGDEGARRQQRRSGGAGDDLEELRAEEAVGAEQHRGVPVDVGVLGVDAHRRHRLVALALDAHHLADLHPGDLHGGVGRERVRVGELRLEVDVVTPGHRDR